MADHQNNSYSLIEKVIDCVHKRPKMPLDVALISEEIGMPFQQIDTALKEWSGVGLHEFVKLISLERIMKVLPNSSSTPTLFDTVDEQNILKNVNPNVSFVEIEEMTIEDQKNGAESLSINYSYQTTIFGAVLIASTDKGVCYLAFYDKKEDAFNELSERFPTSNFIPQVDHIQKNALECFTKNGTPTFPIVLHLKGTEFQFSVWRQLLKIPQGALTTYGGVSEEIKKPKASRAVGTAIGSNPIAYIIPCHRVVQSTGGLGGYMWGETRKTALIGWEATQLV